MFIYIYSFNIGPHLGPSEPYPAQEPCAPCVAPHSVEEAAYAERGIADLQRYAYLSRTPQILKCFSAPYKHHSKSYHNQIKPSHNHLNSYKIIKDNIIQI